MRIVQVAPDIYSIPPENYGGIERVMYDLIEELAKRGHEVILYAPKGSKTSARLIPYLHEKPWSPNEIIKDVLTTLPKDIDIIHDHTHASVMGRITIPVPVVCTEHFSANCPVKYPIYVSNTVREKYGQNKGYCVYHGINLEEFKFKENKEDYFFYIGKLDESKGPQFALDVSERTGKMLIIAGPIHDERFFNKNLKPRINSNPNVNYIGEVGGSKKIDLIKNAKTVLFPTLCKESFGLVAVEAMACGTPVLAFDSGAVSEVLFEFPGLICRNVNEMIEKAFVEDYPTPKALREYCERKFTVQIMTDKYLEVYRSILNERIPYL